MRFTLSLILASAAALRLPRAPAAPAARLQARNTNKKSCACGGLGCAACGGATLLKARQDDDLEVPVFDAGPYKRAYYQRFTATKFKERGGLALATTREAVAAPSAELALPPVRNWRELFATEKASPLGYARRQALRESFFKAAEIEHGRAALLGSVVFASVSRDARLWYLVLFARCGCPSALADFAQGVPNMAVELPLAAASVTWLGRELLRALGDAPAPAGRDLMPASRGAALDEATRKARGLASRAELFQGRVAMLGTSLVVLLAQPLTGHVDEVSNAVADAADAVVGAAAVAVADGALGAVAAAAS
mmetsp:Transcript_19176/g.56950  ORF Transcript_19176/g.56950 Transcript_19176/m.56950 type:complete len:310 (-) Transcript_19176:83-1012(-)|eukprot:CAMPEP_0119259990 /NCGR_PEP_ID=MMETSP1329-20130426/584_1 /TAXON_ID=114041 /ORGANISM="Genus nov. species nov., Strain RCC1024" /LENGTH=309 /DNA_ID=CAMNT_0007259403 /DNA_START=187 /DNA_END=1116 /DNA_ORIENTATION=+